MSNDKLPILVFGATGQQGGSVAAALLKAGWPVRALVRDPSSEKAQELSKAGAEVVKGDLADEASLDAAMKGVHGVFSVQPSSPDPRYGISDEDEVRYGNTIADLAVKNGVEHLVYTSVGAVTGEPTGMGHFDSKLQIENHIRSLPITYTIVRPTSFMEILAMPGFGLDQGCFSFFMKPDQKMQFLAVSDIGKYVAAIFADKAKFAGVIMSIASDSLTGKELEAAFSEAAGRAITYGRFPDEVLAGNPFLAGLTALLDNGPLAGDADLVQMKALNPEVMSFQTWLATDGRDAFRAALGTAGSWLYNEA